MASRVKFGRIWTVPIQGTYSLFVLILIVAGMTAWQFSSIASGYSVGAYALAGIGSAALFIWTVFAHESAHVAVARHFRARVNGVTLSFLGGEAAISGQPGTPWQGIAVAAVGPVVSALCGGICIGLAFGGALLGLPTLVLLTLAWVGFMNLVLAIANMIPAAPLDGGHILQGLIWAKTGNRTRASAVSGFAGQIVGALAIVGAAWLLVRDHSILGAAATAVVGWPLWRGASATRRVAKQREHLNGLVVAEAMRRNHRVVAANEQLGDVVGHAPQRGYVPVVDDAGHPVAVVAAAALRRAAQGDTTRTVGTALRRGRRRLITTTTDEPLADVLERSHGQPRAAAVMSEGRLVGILDPQDVQAHLDRPMPTPARRRAVVADVWPGAR